LQNDVIIENSFSPKAANALDTTLATSLDEAVLCIQELKKGCNRAFIQDVALLLAKTFQEKNKVLIAGNGGSLCDANHFAEELTGFFRKKRSPFGAIALSDAGHITCTANDLGFEWVFARHLEALAKPNDVFIGLSTSGNSPNMIRAFEVAKQMRLSTVAFLGKGGGILRDVADYELLISSASTSDRIQEAHMTAIHAIIELVELHIS